MFVILVIETIVVISAGVLVFNNISNIDVNEISGTISNTIENSIENIATDSFDNISNTSSIDSDISNAIDINNSIENVTNTSTNSSGTSINNTAKKSSKANPLSINDWGIASRYSSGDYVDVPARVTNITRGTVAAQEVKEHCESGSSIYKYSEPKENMEWAVVEYEIDLTNVTSNVSTYLNTSVTGISDYSAIQYNGYNYYTSTMNLTSGFDNSKIVNAKFAVQLPVGCSDYLIILGSSSGSQAFFAGK